jgi:hypothetical protein
MMPPFLLLLASLVTILRYVNAEMSTVHDHRNHVAADNDDANTIGYTTWMAAFHDKISEIASVWSSRIVVTIAIIVFYDLFSPERRRKRRKELEERQVLLLEQQKQILKKEQEEKEKKADGEVLSSQEDATDSTDQIPFQGTAYKLGKNAEGYSSSSTTDKILQDEDKESKDAVGSEEHRSLQNRFLDRLEKEQKSIVDVDVTTSTTLDGQASGNDNGKENTKSDKSSSNEKKTKRPTPHTPQQQSKPPRPRMKATNNAHPGMDEFAYWYDVETSLFRIYTQTRKDGVDVVPPYVPHSHRGNVSIYLDVTNMTNHTINVFWVDYKGKQVLKGTMKPNHTWTQTTFIDHRTL